MGGNSQAPALAVATGCGCVRLRLALSCVFDWEAVVPRRRPGHPGWSIWPADSEQFLRSVCGAEYAGPSSLQVATHT